MTRMGVASLRMLPALFVVALFAVIVWWFGARDVYHRHFFDRGPVVVRYNQMRLLAIPYLAWLVYAPGVALLTVICGRAAPQRLSVMERYLLGFFTGLGTWQLALFTAGLAGLYTRAAAVTAAFAVLILSIPHLQTCLNEAFAGLKRFLTKGNRPGLPALAVAGLTVLAVLAFVLIKGLYPAGGHDYYTHYFEFYKAVLARGSILPNDVWYHFYYSKGAGVYFLAMLLLDPLAPQLMCAGFILAGAFGLWVMLRHAAPYGLWAGVAVLLYITLLVFTPGVGQHAANGGWADLEKLHEPASVSLLGVLLLTTGFLRRHAAGADRREQAAWALAMWMAAVAAVTFTNLIALFLGGWLVLLAAWLFLRRRRVAALVCFLGACAAGGTLALFLLVNYVLTGMPTDQGVLPLWPYIDIEKLRVWGVLFEIVRLHWAHTGLVANRVPLDLSAVTLVFRSLRLDLLWPLLLPLLVVPWRWLRRRRASESPMPPELACLLLLLALFCTFTVVFGRAQPISFYRFSSFMFAPTLAACLLLDAWLMPPRVGKAWLAGVLAPLFLAACVFGAAYESYKRGAFANIRINALHFVNGRFSLKDAYQNQQGWPGRMPWGGIYPGAEKVWQQVAPGTRIWSFHVHSYCMLPGCRMESFMSYRFSPEWDRVFYGSPEEAKRILQSEGLDYFFFSSELQLRDPLPLAPLFKPENIGRTLAIQWTDGTSYLLTWPREGATPPDEEFLAAYAKSVSESPEVRSFYWKEFRQVFEGFREQQGPLRTFPMPW